MQLSSALPTFLRGSVAAVVSLALGFGYLSVQAVPAHAVDPHYIWDQGLAECVAAEIPGYSGDGMTFTEAELTAITGLSCANKGISDLSGLVGLRNVTTADFSNNQIVDTTSISELFRIVSLNLSGNQITDLVGFGADSLTTLDVSNNHILDLSPLDARSNITSVTATGQTGSWTIPVNEASALPLVVRGTSLPQTITSSDLSLTIADGMATGTTAGTYTIDFLDDQNGVTFSGTLTTVVDAGPVTIPDAGFAACLDDKLGVTGNIFSSVTLAGITSLDCSNRNIASLSGAIHLTGATSLDFSHNEISSAAALGANPALTTLNLAYNKIQSINAVPSSNLVSIDISYNKIADASPFAVYPDLTTLDASGQSLAVTVEADTATDLVVSDYSGAVPTFSWPTGVTYDAGQVTAAAGIYTIAFSSESGSKVFSGTLALSAHADVDIPDSHLAQCIAVALNQTPSTRTFSNLDLATINSLPCANQSVGSLDGMQYLINVAYLDVSYNLISDLSPLAGLTGLIDLHLTHNKISDVSPLAGVTSVSNLYLDENTVGSIADLSTLTNVAVLDVSDNRLSSLTGVAGKIWLSTLNASGNQLVSLAPISALTRLKVLDVSDNQLTSLTVLEQYGALAKAKLTTLYVSGNRLTALPNFTGFTALSKLDFADNKLTSLAPLSGTVSKLTLANFANNQISSLNGVAGHPLVMALDVSGNQISDVSDLSGLSMLNSLEIYDNQITDLSPLSGLSALLTINARNQRPTIAVYPTVATDLGLKDNTGSAPGLGTLPDGVSVDADKVTAASEGSFEIPFSSGDYGSSGVEFSGTLTVKSTYNTFTTATPTITGTPKVDSTLTAHTGTWSPEPTFGYQWRADGVDIAGATDSTFVPTGAEVGKAITVTVTGTKDTYAATPVTSAATESVAQATFTSPDKVKVSGWYTVGETLTASATWTPTPDSVTYIWLRDDVPIDGATAATYQLTAADSGHSIAAQIAVTKAGYVSDSLTSAAKAVVDGVIFPDANLRSCIATALNSYPVAFTNQELASLTSLNCEGMTITDLTGAEALTGLTSLNLRGNAITDFSPISSLIGLQSLNVSYANLTNLDAFSGLTGLTSLDASNNLITDISGISGLTGLTTLDLSTNRITSLGALSGLTELTTLAAAGNEISDLSPLAGLSKLATPDLTAQNPTVRGEAGEDVSNPVQGLSGGFTTYDLPDGVTLIDGKFNAPAGVYTIPFSVAVQEGETPYFTGYVRFESHTDVFIADLGFAGCLSSSLNLSSTTQSFSNIDLAGIFDLDCAGRGVYSIEGAQHLAMASMVDFDDNDISDLSPLAGLKTTLVTLKARNNALQSIAPLADHSALQNLYLSGNSISDLSALSSAVDLRIVEVSSNRLTSLNGLGGHANLLTVTASGNELTDISALAALPRVTGIDVSNNQLTGLSVLSTSTATARLKTLTVSGNRISSISVLSAFTKLTTLRAANNKISDLTPLTGLTQLLEVDVTNNQVTSLAGLSGHAVLITLKASGNQLTSVSPLSGLALLNDVEVYDNHIADLSPLADVASRGGILNARGQTVSQTVVPQVATPIAVTDAAGAVPAVGTLPEGISVDSGAISANAEGTYAVPFVSGDFAVNSQEFSGTLTVTAAYNTFTTATPTITGTPKVGLTLTAHPGTWSPEPTFAYQWKADGADIVDATGATFTPTSGEEGKAISVTVTGSKDTYAAASLTSAATQTVAQGTFAMPSEITVSGTFAVGQTVTASPGTWSPAGAISYQWLRGGSPILGATDASYTLTPDDAGKAVSVRVSASAPGYEPGAVPSTATAVALGTMDGDKPVIVGTVAIGNTLQVGTGYWNPSPTFSLQWYRAGYPIEGATGYEYTVTAADVGKAITVAQTGTVTGYTPLTRLSDSTSPVPSGSLSTSTGAAVDGTMAVGHTLTAQAGTWTPTPDSFSYQWLSDGGSIDGATSSTYVLGAGDEGHVITVTVTAIKAGYTPASATSSDEGAVAKGSFITATPTITGTATFGHTLKAAVDPWAPVANLTWQWLRDGSPIDEATGSSYVLGTDDLGAKISVAVTGRLSGYADTTTTSVQTDPVQAAGFTAPVAITISGDLAVGELLSVQGASWAPTPDSISFRWLRNGSAIAGATGSTYRLTAADLDAVITVEVTAAKAGYTASVVTSQAGDPVAANGFDADVPVISGTAVVDETLTATSSGWSPTPTTLTYQWQADGIDIAGADLATLTLTPATQGKAITVTVKGEADGYADKVLTSAATAKVAAAELVGSTSVAVSGSAVVGSTLSAEDVSWKPSPDSVTFQWLRGGVAIDGANDQSYLLTAADMNKVVTVSVTAVKAGYRTVVLHSVATEPVAAASFAPATPVISGSAVVDQTLTATAGTWAPVPSESSLQWKRDGKAIDGATGETYLVTSADVGARLTVSVTGSSDGYAQATATSVPTDAVVKASFTAPDAISVTGTMRAGEYLTANPGTWTPTPDAVSYQWRRNGEPVEGATAAAYLLGASDVDAVITVTVTATKAGYTTASLTSVDGDAVAAGIFAAPQPTVTGTTTVGATLTATVPSWAPSPSAISYQWLADGEAIDGATGLTHTLSAAELGKAITFAVTGTKTGYVQATATSQATALVAAADLTAPASVSLSGDLVVGARLSAHHGTWSPSPDAYSYRWLRNGTAIDGAIDATYTLVAADQGAVMSVEVTAAKAGYNDATLTSANSDAVAAGQFDTVSPWISGNALIGSTLTANVGSWSPEPSTYRYQWNADGDPIPDATASTFAVTAAQAGKVISLSVTGELDGYVTTTINTGGTDAVPEASFTGPGEVTVSGEAVVGSTLSADAGSWTPTPSSITYQWMRGSSEISGADADSYTLTAADRGKVVTVKVTATLAGYRPMVIRSVADHAVIGSAFTTATPVISGTVQLGETLTVDPGTWTPAPTTQSIQWKRNGKNIAGATHSTYVLDIDDVGATITVVVSGVADGYEDASVTSEATGEVAPADFSAPANATVSGTMKVGQVLEADAGSWSPTPEALSYQWYRDGSAISGADAAHYTLVAADSGAQITVKVTATSPGYASAEIGSVAADPVSEGEFITQQPLISGLPKVGSTLTAKPGTWNPTPESWTYQWYRNGEEIDQATEATYTLTSEDLDAVVTVKISASRHGYVASGVVESDPVEVSPAGHFTAPDEVAVTGQYQVGRALTAVTGTWSPSPESFRYQWMRNGVAISGATASTYTLAASDLDAVITVKVTGAKDGYVSASVRSSASGAVKAGAMAAGVVSIAGIPRIGQALTVNAGTWSPAPSALSYQWYRSGAAISGATGSRYVVTAADVWKNLTVSVTGSLSGYATTTAVSAATTAVPQGVLAGPTPKITGKVKVKKTLKVVVGIWSPRPDKVTYQWYRNGKAIKKATKSSYKLTKKDKRKKITVKVKLVKAGYATRVVTSRATAKVK